MNAQDSSRPEPADMIKQAALRLFSEHGVDGVTVRQIAEAAGQKNHAAVGYHFGSKEELVRAVIIHGARLIDEVRNAMLDEMEARGGPKSVIEIVDLLVRSSLLADNPPWSACYNSFIVVAQLSNRRLVAKALGGRWNSGYQRCLDHLRKLSPNVPRAIMNQRLIFMGAALGGILASRERELADRSRKHPMWESAATLKHATQCLAAIILCDR
jgi:AcrR family transcriptional regulator